MRIFEITICDFKFPGRLARTLLMPRMVKTGTAALYLSIRQVLEQARASAYRAVNFAMVQAYWQGGYLIVEHEQGGKHRADYGEALLEELSRRLTREFGRGFDVRNLRYMRQFYQTFPPHHALEQESGHGKKRNAARSRSATANIRNAVRSESSGSEAGMHHAASNESVRPALRTELSWTHYRLLLRVEKTQAREWYMHEAADQN